MEMLNNSTDANNTGAKNFPSVKLSLLEMSAITALYVVLVLAALIGNSLILTAFTVNKKLRTITHTLVMGLAVSDILVGLVSIPCWVYINLSGYNGESENKDVVGFYTAFDIFIGTASILQLTCISIERCHAVVKPLEHRTLSKHIFYAMIAVPWLYAALMGFLHPLQYQNWEEAYTILMTSTCFVIPFLIIIAAYISIYRHTKRRSIIIKRHNTVSKGVFNNELQLSITLAFITIIFVVSWLPLFLVSIIAIYSLGSLGTGIGTIRLVKFVKWMHYSNSAINPYVYSYRNSGIRTTLRITLYRAFCRTYKPVTIYQHQTSRLDSKSTWRSLSSKLKGKGRNAEEVPCAVEMCSSV